MTATTIPRRALASCDLWLLDRLMSAAEAGERCPSNVEIQGDAARNGVSFGPTNLGDAMGRLRLAGLLVTEIIGTNYRRIRVRLAVSDGWLATADHPNGWPPWRVLDHAGERRR